MRQFMFTTVLVLGALVAAQADDHPEFLKAKPPKFVFVESVNVEKGQLEYTESVDVPRVVLVEVDTVEGGKKTKKQVPMEKLETVHRKYAAALSELRVTTADGKAVSTPGFDYLKGKVVVVSGDRNEISDLYLKLLSKDTYVIAFKPMKKSNVKTKGK